MHLLVNVALQVPSPPHCCLPGSRGSFEGRVSCPCDSLLFACCPTTLPQDLQARRQASLSIGHDVADTAMEEALIEVPNSTKNKDGKQDPEIHQAKKGNQWYFGMKVHAGVDKDSGLIHSVVLMAANVHDLTPAAELLQGDEEEVYGIAAGFCEAVAGYQGIAQRPEMASTGVEFRVGMRPGKRRGLPDMPDGRPLDLI